MRRARHRARMRAPALRPLLLACLLAATLAATLTSVPVASGGVSVGFGGFASGIVGNPQIVCATAHASADRASCDVLAPASRGDVVLVRTSGMRNVHVLVLDEERHAQHAAFDCRSPLCIVPLSGSVWTTSLRFVVIADAAMPGAASLTSVETWLP
jgi:hypothetical protein